jgi:pyrroline-5-carboxylate reductase
MKLAIIGAGNMAKAIIQAVLKGNVAAAPDITASDTNPAKLEALQNSLKINITADNSSAINQADVIILAIKPQNIDEFSQEVSGKFAPGQLIISILAGTPLKRLAGKLGHNEIIRAMPNTPAQIGEGMTVWTCPKEVSPEQKNKAEAILSSMGRALFVEDENYINMATAISGSGPAYFFLFMEYLSQTAERLGFDTKTARELVLQTALGSVKYAASSGKDPADLREQVTSPGGTTAEAISRFNSGGLKETIDKAVTAAYQKAIEMSKD